MRRLLQKLQEQTLAVISAEHTEVTRIDEELRQLTEQCDTLARDRIVAAAALAATLPHEEGEELPTIGTLATRVGGGEGERLAALRGQLVMLHDEAAAVRHRNTLLLETALDVVRGALEAIARECARPPVYGSVRVPRNPSFLVDQSV
jgi:hypothetical protein